MVGARPTDEMTKHPHKTLRWAQPGKRKRGNAIGFMVENRSKEMKEAGKTTGNSV